MEDNTQNIVTGNNATDAAVLTPSPTPVDNGKSLKAEDYDNINGGMGINLIPGYTQEELELKAKKTRANYTGILVFIVLAVLSVIVLGVNAVFKIQLNTERKATEQLREELASKAYLISSNNQIYDRIILLKSVQDNTYSPEEVLNFWMDTVDDYGSITSFELENDLEFTLKGSANSYEDAAKLWHVLSVDERVSVLTIDRIGRSEESNKSNFTFEGQLNTEYFIDNQVKE